MNSYPLGLTLAAALLLAATPATAQLRIFHIDVENADATLFVAPGGETLLIDSGSNGHGARIKAVYRTPPNRMRRSGRERILLEVETDNRRALELYRDCGFREISTYDYYRFKV